MKKQRREIYLFFYYEGKDPKTASVLEKLLSKNKSLIGEGRKARFVSLKARSVTFKLPKGALVYSSYTFPGNGMKMDYFAGFCMPKCPGKFPLLAENGKHIMVNMVVGDL